jgi:hypothetical protein
MQTPVAANDNDRLLTLEETAERLGVCKRTLGRHIGHGDLAYIVTGNGRQRLQRKIHPVDLQNFIDARRRFDCQSTSQPKARTTHTISKLAAIGFMAQRNARLSERRISSSP